MSKLTSVDEFGETFVFPPPPLLPPRIPLPPLLAPDMTSLLAADKLTREQEAERIELVRITAMQQAQLAEAQRAAREALQAEQQRALDEGNAKAFAEANAKALALSVAQAQEIARAEAQALADQAALAAQQAATKRAEQGTILPQGSVVLEDPIGGNTSASTPRVSGGVPLVGTFYQVDSEIVLVTAWLAERQQATLLRAQRGTPVVAHARESVLSPLSLEVPPESLVAPLSWPLSLGDSPGGLSSGALMEDTGSNRMMAQEKDLRSIIAQLQQDDAAAQLAKEGGAGPIEIAWAEKTLTETQEAARLLLLPSSTTGTVGTEELLGAGKILVDQTKKSNKERLSTINLPPVTYALLGTSVVGDVYAELVKNAPPPPPGTENLPPGTLYLEDAIGGNTSRSTPRVYGGRPLIKTVYTIEDELVLVTDYAEGAKTPTLLRAQQGTALAPHDRGSLMLPLVVEAQTSPMKWLLPIGAILAYLFLV